MFSQLMKVRKLWVRISKVPESPPNSSVTGTRLLLKEASFEISQETVYFWLASEGKKTREGSHRTALFLKTMYRKRLRITDLTRKKQNFLCLPVSG